MTGWKVAAITAAIVGAAGIGAAVGPAAQGQSLKWLEEPEQTVRVVTGFGSQIGVSIRDIEEGDLKGQKPGAVSGVVISDVETDSPAQKAGFKAGDVVVEFDGERVRSTRQFTRLVQETPVGRHVQASVMRDGQRVALTVTPREGSGFSHFGDWSSEVRKMVPVLPTLKLPPLTLKRDILPQVEAVIGSAGRLGITVDELSTQLGDYFGTKEGVLVTSVNDASAAAKAGLKAGDVITSLNGGAVASAAGLRRRAQRLEDGDELTLAIVRDKKAMTLKGKIEAPPQRRWTARTII